MPKRAQAQVSYPYKPLLKTLSYTDIVLACSATVGRLVT